MEHEADMVTDLGLHSDSFFKPTEQQYKQKINKYKQEKQNENSSKETAENCQKLIARIESAGLQTLE